MSAPDTMSVMWTMPYRIETERLVLRPYAESDAAALNDLIDRSREHLSRYLPWAREPETVEQRAEWIRRQRAEYDAGVEYTLGMFSRRDGRLVGGTGFHPRTEPPHLEIGFLVAVDEQGKGFVTESSAALSWIALAFARAPYVAIAHAPSNAASAAVARRLGFAERVRDGISCTDGDAAVTSRVWTADKESLTREPLVTYGRPQIFDEMGAALEWPAQ